MNNWEEGITQSKGKVGVTKIFVNRKLTRFRVDIKENNAELASKDPVLKEFKDFFEQIEGGADVTEECLDKFLDFYNNFRAEKDMDTKFWAFMRGYLDLKMKQL